MTSIKQVRITNSSYNAFAEFHLIFFFLFFNIIFHTSFCLPQLQLSPWATVELYGPWNSKRNALDAYIPQLRRYDVPRQGALEYKDVTTTWKGTSIAQAEEILYWEHAFKTVVEQYIARVLTSSFKDSCPEADAEEVPAKKRERRARDFTTFIKDIGSAVFSIDTQYLVESMINHFKRHAPVQYQWLAGPKHPHDSVCNLLTTYDCFIGGSPPSCKFTVQLFPQYRYPNNVRVKSYVAWTPPLPVFLNLQNCVEDSEEFFLCPRFTEVELSKQYEDFELDTQHHVESDGFEFLWDRSLQAYRVVASASVRYPPHQFMSVHGGQRICTIDATTVAVKRFPDGVRFERVMRCRINLMLLPQVWPQCVEPQEYYSATLPRVRPHRPECTLRSAPTLKTYASTVLRALSQNSVRVQGTARAYYDYDYDSDEPDVSPLPDEYRPSHSPPEPQLHYQPPQIHLLSDFEQSAQEMHDDVFSTYRKANESRHAMERKLYNVTQPEMVMMPRPMTVRMMTDVGESPQQQSAAYMGVAEAGLQNEAGGEAHRRRRDSAVVLDSQKPAEKDKWGEIASEQFNSFLEQTVFTDEMPEEKLKLWRKTTPRRGKGRWTNSSSSLQSTPESKKGHTSRSKDKQVLQRNEDKSSIGSLQLPGPRKRTGAATPHNGEDIVVGKDPRQTPLATQLNRLSSVEKSLEHSSSMPRAKGSAKSKRPELPSDWRAHQIRRDDLSDSMNYATPAVPLNPRESKKPKERKHWRANNRSINGDNTNSSIDVSSEVETSSDQSPLKTPQHYQTDHRIRKPHSGRSPFNRSIPPSFPNHRSSHNRSPVQDRSRVGQHNVRANFCTVDTHYRFHQPSVYKLFPGPSSSKMPVERKGCGHRRRCSCADNVRNAFDQFPGSLDAEELALIQAHIYRLEVECGIRPPGLSPAQQQRIYANIDPQLLDQDRAMAIAREGRDTPPPQGPAQAPHDPSTEPKAKPLTKEEMKQLAWSTATEMEVDKLQTNILVNYARQLSLLDPAVRPNQQTTGNTTTATDQDDMDSDRRSLEDAFMEEPDASTDDDSAQDSDAKMEVDE
ncbi:hypothetical protein NA57DRAFT_78586 [Rhizodiscina lignyota]|uniref:Uncharacterized protein n=1 Tax=Rhizodiscina lignyota TaxID=1504668 RepID=A0A9P4IC28_9PEZI|nr:hypothetical protein NA57DRAFT_78586 [Rhizodiscina lignyota]